MHRLRLLSPPAPPPLYSPPHHQLLSTPHCTTSENEPEKDGRLQNRAGRRQNQVRDGGIEFVGGGIKWEMEESSGHQRNQLGSIEGRVGVHHIDDSQQSKNFTFKCHRDGNEIYSVNSLNFHPVHGTFATAGSDEGFNFWDNDSKQRLKAFSKCPAHITCSTFNQDGSIFAYAVCYDWSKGAEKHNSSTAKTNIFLHGVQEADVKGKPRARKK